MNKIKKYLTITLLHILVLSTAGAVIYARVATYVANKEKQVLQEQVKNLQSELEITQQSLKAK